MSIKATTEPMFFPSSGTWRNVPIKSGFTPGIIDYYPEGPGETRPTRDLRTDYDIFQEGMVGRTMPGQDLNLPVLRYPQARLPGQTGFGIGDSFALETQSFGGGLAGQNPMWGALGGLIGAGLGKLFAK